MKSIFFTRKNLIIITIVIALLLIASVLIYDPHLTPQSAAKSPYNDINPILEYEDKNFYYVVYESGAFSTAKKTLFFWRSDYYHEKNLDASQRQITKIGDAYYYYGKVLKPHTDNVKTIKLTDTSIYPSEINPLKIIDNDKYFFFVFKFDSSDTVNKKIVFSDFNGNIITDNRREIKTFNLNDINKQKSNSYVFKETDIPEFNTVYNNLIYELVTNGKKYII